MEQVRYAAYDGDERALLRLRGNSDASIWNFSLAVRLGRRQKRRDMRRRGFTRLGLTI